MSCPLIKSDSQAGIFELQVIQGQGEARQGVLPLESWSLSTKPEARKREKSIVLSQNAFLNVNSVCDMEVDMVK